MQVLQVLLHFFAEFFSLKVKMQREEAQKFEFLRVHHNCGLGFMSERGISTIHVAFRCHWLRSFKFKRLGRRMESVLMFVLQKVGYLVEFLAEFYFNFFKNLQSDRDRRL